MFCRVYIYYLYKQHTLLLFIRTLLIYPTIIPSIYTEYHRVRIEEDINHMHGDTERAFFKISGGSRGGGKREGQVTLIFEDRDWGVLKEPLLALCILQIGRGALQLQLNRYLKQAIS